MTEKLGSRSMDMEDTSISRKYHTQTLPFSSTFVIKFDEKCSPHYYYPYWIHPITIQHHGTPKKLKFDGANLIFTKKQANQDFFKQYSVAFVG